MKMLISLLAVLSAAPQQQIEAAQQALKPFKQSLQAALKEGLSKGPAAAVETCHAVAPTLPSRAATEQVMVGRTSNKLRNGDNAPKEWMKPFLSAYASGATSPHETVNLPNGALGYVEPIYVQPTCLSCHGPKEQVDPAVKKVLAENYPNDQATGYKVGEFRGLFWAEVKPLSKPAK